MTSPSRPDWRVVLLAVVAGAGALMCLSLAAAMAGYTVLGPWLRPIAAQPVDARDSAGILVLAGGTALVGCVLIATLLAAGQSLRGRVDLNFETRSMRWWVILIFLVAWLGASALAQFITDGQQATWAIPLLQLIAIASPIYVLSRLAIAGIRGGSRLRLWGSVTTGMLLGTGLAAVMEIILLLAAAAAGAVYLLGNPQQVIGLQRLAIQLARSARPEETLTLLGPILTSPLTVAVALGAVAIATPFVEEVAKSVAVWAQHDRISTGAHGFWVGALSGAGFALFEGMMVSSDTSESLAFILVLRAGSSLMHIVASGLAGWGIGAYRSTGRLRRAAAGYVAAMLIHSLWNAVVVTIGYGAIRSAYGAEQPDPAGLALSMGGGMILAALMGLLPIALLGLNMRFRRHTAALSGADSPSDGAQSAPAVEKASK